MTEPKTTESQSTEHTQRELAKHLTGVLADSYLLYQTTQFCHWNVVGPQFRPLHEMFEEQYRGLAEAIDLIAERIRVLGFYTPGTLLDYVELSDIEQPKTLQETGDMLEQLIADHAKVAERIRRALSSARAAADEATFDLLVERLRAHEKTGWMLESQAGREPLPIGLQGADRSRVASVAGGA